MSPGSSIGEEARVRDFAAKVARALAAKGVLGEPVTRTEARTVSRKAGWFRTEQVSEPHQVVVFTGWVLWHQMTREVLWKATDLLGKVNHKALGRQERETVAIYLANDGRLMAAVQSEAKDHTFGRQYDHTFINAVPATWDDIQQADHRWQRRNERTRLTHEWWEWHRVERKRKPGMGISTQLRQLADAHDVLPKSSKPARPPKTSRSAQPANEPRTAANTKKRVVPRSPAVAPKVGDPVSQPRGGSTPHSAPARPQATSTGSPKTPRSVVVEAHTSQDAIIQGIKQLGRRRDQVTVRILQQTQSGLYGRRRGQVVVEVTEL
jgi:hypothetical protein